LYAFHETTYQTSNLSLGNVSCVAWQRRRTRWLRYWISE